MQLAGSCYCNAVGFSAWSHTPYPYMRCYCSICRKTAGGGGFAINIMAQADTLVTHGGDSLNHHSGKVEDPEHPTRLMTSPGKRYFCKYCGSFLWSADPRWPEWIYPFASAIDTPLPKPPETVHIMLEFAAPWLEIPAGPTDRHFPHYPDESIRDWHIRHGLYQD